MVGLYLLSPTVIATRLSISRYHEWVANGKTTYIEIKQCRYNTNIQKYYDVDVFLHIQNSNKLTSSS